MVGSTSPYSILLVAGDGENASIDTPPQLDVPKISRMFRGVYVRGDFYSLPSPPTCQMLMLTCPLAIMHP